MMWFYSWTQENLDADWKTFSIALVRRFGKRNYGVVVEEKLIEKDKSNTQVLSEKRDEVDPNGDVNGIGYDNQIICSGANCSEAMTEFDVATKKIEADRTRVSVTLNHKMVEAVDTPPPSDSPEFPKPKPPNRDASWYEGAMSTKPPDPNLFIVVGAIHEMQNPWFSVQPQLNAHTAVPPEPEPPDIAHGRRKFIVTKRQEVLEKLRVFWVMYESVHILTLLDQTHHNLSRWEKEIKMWARLEPLKQAQNKVCLLSNPCVQKKHVTHGLLSVNPIRNRTRIRWKSKVKEQTECPPLSSFHFLPSTTF
jgi:hypothetical protein